MISRYPNYRKKFKKNFTFINLAEKLWSLIAYANCEPIEYTNKYTKYMKFSKCRILRAELIVNWAYRVSSTHVKDRDKQHLSSMMMKSKICAGKYY